MIINNEGSIVTLLPGNNEEKEWCLKHIPDAMCLGQTRCVEYRYAEDILYGMQEDGILLRDANGKVFFLEGEEDYK